MSMDTSSTREFVRETARGQKALMDALVIALHETGAMPMQRYIETLNRLWIDMPEQEALGEAGAAIERMIEKLEAHIDAKVPVVPLVQTTTGPERSIDESSSTPRYDTSHGTPSEKLVDGRVCARSHPL